MAAVAGVTALAIGGASDFRQDRVEYRAELPMGSAVVRPRLDRADAAGPAIRRVLPGVPVVTLRGLPGPGGTCLAEDTAQCPAISFSPEEEKMTGFKVVDNVVGGAREARMLLGRDDPAVTSALAAGKIVLLGSAPPTGGTVTAKVVSWADDEQRVAATVEDLPAVAVRGDAPASAIVPATTARRIAAETGLPVRTEAYGVDRADHRVTEAEQARLEAALAAFAPGAEDVYVERGFTGSFGKVALVLGGIAAVLALGGSLIATGLASADARPDLATLGAIGARPGTRRLLTMGRAAFIAALGCWLGIAGGLVPGLAVTRPLTSEVPDGVPPHGVIVDVPWTLLLAVGLGIPLLVALVAGAFTRSRLPMARRITA
jgi:putative ABC transport system permease protein